MPPDTAFFFGGGGEFFIGKCPKGKAKKSGMENWVSGKWTKKQKW